MDNSETPAWLIEDPPEAPAPGVPAQPAASQGVASAQQVTLDERSSEPAGGRRGGGGGGRSAGPPRQQQLEQRAAAAATQHAQDAAVRSAADAFNLRRPLEINQYVHWLRGVNMIGMFVVAFLCVLILMGTPDLAPGTLACYVFALSSLFCCFELQFAWLIRLIGGSFGLLYTAAGRLAFLGLTAMMMVALGGAFGFIAGICLWALGAINFFVLCRWPDYTEYNLRIMEEKALQEHGASARRNGAVKTQQPGMDV
mmetsp:Transcript_8063/g.14243  ORF Transcript_8063/g.14243 Transcript_8063/m.14243 type:complete len:255 (+) Transcript_8063:176-940(+)|eukprot:CAMPEP_0194576872 /NCGR_PEP_ID=MMETSP0292-20121207/11844_1 /TAXON_ID=39354 /ORGANISM="Heterosigma akashiwo, Strain CCMP2393" /LENGTH=254 /DNA_ID=CAMNT_0039429069 /DNA_START=153 /DNA_END=917 /DNA_ORIENTATION=-